MKNPMKDKIVQDAAIFFRFCSNVIIDYNTFQCSNDFKAIVFPFIGRWKYLKKQNIYSLKFVAGVCVQTR